MTGKDQEASGGDESQEPSRPAQILQDRVGNDTISDEEAVLAYNANADPDAGAESAGAAEDE